MDSSSGNSSGSPPIQNSGSDTDLMDQKKRKRMQSNRESAQRSRMRKRNHLDDLTAEINQFKNNNTWIVTTMKITTQQFVQIEAENNVLKAHISELIQRLDSLNEMINCTTTQCSNGTGGMFEFEEFGLLNCPWSLMYLHQQAIMASAVDMLQY